MSADMTDIPGQDLRALGKILGERAVKLEGAWALEAFEDGEIGVLRNRRGTALGFMHPDDLRALWDEEEERKETER